MTEPARGYWLTKFIILTVLLSLPSIATVCTSNIPSPATPRLQASNFVYQVRVQGRDTNRNIPNAEVTLEVLGKAPLVGFTDSTGLARLQVPATHAGQPGRFIVEAEGYRYYWRNIDLSMDLLPDQVQLDPISPTPTLAKVPMILSPSPTNTDTSTATPTHTATPTASPTNTPIPTPAETQKSIPAETPIPSSTTSTFTQTPIPTNTSSPTKTAASTNLPPATVAQMSPTKTSTRTSTNTATPSSTPTDTSTSTATPTLTSSPTPTVTVVLPTATPTFAPTPGADSFVLLNPLDLDDPTYGPTIFEWEWHSPLAEYQGFEIRVWREGQPPYGAHDAVADNQPDGLVKVVGANKYRAEINIQGAAGIQGRGEYLWTVALVQISPEYADLGIQAAPALLRFETGDGGNDTNQPDKTPPAETP